MKSYSIKMNCSALFLILMMMNCSNNKSHHQVEKATLPFYNDASFTPHWFNANSDSLLDFHKVAPFQLVNQDSQIISNKNFEGKIYVTDFFFTSCPGICPKMTNNMLILQDSFLNDQEVLLLSHSATPERDSISVLQIYAETHGIQSSTWHLVTGERQLIYDLGRKTYFIEEDLGINKDINDFLHTENFILIDKKQHIRGIYNGLNKASIQQLITDIKILKKEI